jgi:hypothetical protein
MRTFGTERGDARIGQRQMHAQQLNTLCVTKYYYGVNTEDDEIHRTSSMHGKMKNANKIVVE